MTLAHILWGLAGAALAVLGLLACGFRRGGSTARVETPAPTPSTGHTREELEQEVRERTAELARANEEMWLGFGADYREAVGVDAATPLEQAYPLVFLCSDAASYVNGVTVIADAGYVSSGITESFPDATPVVGFLNSEF